MTCGSIGVSYSAMRTGLPPERADNESTLTFLADPFSNIFEQLKAIYSPEMIIL